MASEQAPDWVIRSYNFGGTRNNTSNNQLYMPPQTKVDQLNSFTQNLAGKDSLAAGTTPVAGSAVSGGVAANSVGIAPATSVAVKETNMLVSNNFTTPDSIVAQQNWAWDGTDGNITPGCAAVLCNGMQAELVSNEIPVITGETIEVTCQVKWSGLVYTGSNPIVLGVEKYRKGRDKTTGGVTYMDVGGFDVAAVPSPGPDSDWEVVSLAGTYVVQQGVDQLRFRFKAARTITQGIVKWDEANFLKLDLIDDNAVPGVGETVDDIVRRLFGTEGEGFTHNDSAVALGNTAAALLSVNARLSALEAEGSTGTIAGDDFLWTGEVTASANWGGVYSDSTLSNGFYAGNGTDAAWNGAGFTPASTNQECRFDWQGSGATSGTDYQLIQLVLSSAPTTSAGYRSWIYLLGRISSGYGSYVRAGFCSDGTYFVDYWNGSAFIGLVTPGTCAVPGSSALLSLYCGDKANTLPRHFKLMINNILIAEFDEIGTGSPLGAGNRKWGWGAKAEGGLYFALITFLPTQAIPPTINQWLAYDQ